MNILIDINHPAHVHMFKYVAWEMIARGYRILFVCREKEFTANLLESYSFEYVNLGHKSSSLAGKVWNMLRFEWKEFQIARHFHADMFISHGSIIAAHVACLMHKPHICFEDTFNMEQVRLYAPFTKVILTADYPSPLSDRKNVLQCACYNELLYLHPNRFKPNPAIIKELGLQQNEKYVIIRFVGWKATHDVGHKGYSSSNKIKAVLEFSKYARVFISSENPLPADLEQYRFPLPPNRLHEAQTFASLVFGESATMASEAAVLGVPSIYVDNTSRLYTQEQEHKYHLCYNFTESESDQQRAIEKGIEILSGQSNIDYAKQRQYLLDDHIDATAFFVWFLENYPESFKIMKENPDYQYRFKLS